MARTPTSATGIDRPAVRSPRGYTLIELVVVLAIVAAMAAIVPFAFSKLQAGAEYRSAARDLISTLRRARSQAETTGRQVIVTIDTEERRYGIGERIDRRLPEALSVRLTAAATEAAGEHRGRIRFYPDGSSTGGSVFLLRPTGEGVQVRVDWLLGRISQHPAQATP